ncbi:HAMP domain-containing histidine kinase [Fulvivirgaceae bacterium PWU37]|uniref:histidine kinase n=2 Tax=Dawidia soli TaxID=2782352 RepID=A0AAP2D7Z8_9BACT|nr:HAMP domain-containing histidine kinase [Dawidia soli]
MRIYLAVATITLLLVLDITFTQHNNTILHESLALQAETEQVKVYYDHISRLVIHSADIGLRGYALLPEERLGSPMNNATAWKDSIFDKVEAPLKKMHYDLTELRALRDSVNAYVAFTFYMRHLIDEGRRDEFNKLFNEDRGARLWYQYEQCENHIEAFADKVHADEHARYEAALTRNLWLQILLFILCVPTLLYTAWHTRQSFMLGQKLHEAEASRNIILMDQNMMLERQVQLRTRELAAQNEEIIAQAEELATHRDHLEAEVHARTHALEQNNRELIDQNHQLEQFSFIAAHNLRAPLARIMGIATLLELTEDKEEQNALREQILTSANDLDEVIKDLNVILELRRNTGNFSLVDFQTSLERAEKMLTRELEQTDARLVSDFTAAPQLYAVAPYIDSILFNLVSNALKYRSPERTPAIHVRTIHHDDMILLTVTDNGLGIDLQKHGKDIFNLYKRFHRKIDGKGLGLYLVRSQVTAMGGKIEVESTPGEGTTFKIYLRNATPLNTDRI